MKLAKVCVFAAATLFAAPLGAQMSSSIAVGAAFPGGDLGEVSSAGFAFALINQIPIGMTPFSVRILSGYNRFRLSLPPGTSVGKAQQPAYVEITAGLQVESPREYKAIPYANVNWGFFHGDGSVPSRIAGGNGKTDHLGGSIGVGIKFRAIARNLFLEARYVTISGGDQYVPVTLGMSF